MKSFFALVTPFDPSLKPDHGLPGPQPTPPRPGSPPRPDHTLPGQLPHPSHPIYYPLPPGAPPPVVDNTLPGTQPPVVDNTLPGAGSTPGTPTHPIVLPPDAEGGWGPIYIWGGGPGARPPIALPPDGPAPPEAPGKIEWEAVWSPENGWQTIGVIVPEGKPTPTPSKK